jgi:isocitrate dehydrogenase
MWKVGGSHSWEGKQWTVEIIDDSNIQKYQDEGWFMTWTEALSTEKPAKSVQEPSDRELLEAEAKSLGIEFDKRTTDKKLAEKIAAAKG